MRMGGMLGALLPLLSGSALGQVTLSGEVPYFESPGIQQKLDRIWEHEAQTYLLRPKTARNTPAPEIVFFEFDKAGESTDWQSWQKNWIRDNPAIWLDWTKINGIPPEQVTQSWIDQHVDTLFPFPPTFLAFHYDHTNRIQLSPSHTFLRYYQNDPYGVKSETVGYGFYVVSHEMMHHVLEQDGIPGPLHHCLFVTERNGRTLMQEMAKYLIDQKISSTFIQNFGYEAEKSMNPCFYLTKEEQEEAKQYLETSKVWN